MVHFLSWKIFAAPVYNQVNQEQQAFVQETLEVRVVEETIEALPQERVQQHTALQIVHEPVPQIQEQSAVTRLVNSQFLIAAVEASQIVDSFFSLGRVLPHPPK